MGLDTTVLVETLRLAVPLHIMELRTVSEQQRAFIGNNAAAVVGEKGDVLQFGSKTAKGRRDTAHAFNTLALGLACLAYVPGGVEFAGVHWCVWDHPGGATGVDRCRGGEHTEIRGDA